MSKHEGRPPHPTYGPPLSGAPWTEHGVTFRPYSSGVLRYIRISDDFRIELRERGDGGTLSVRVDGQDLPTRFRKRATAVAAALKVISK